MGLVDDFGKTVSTAEKAVGSAGKAVKTVDQADSAVRAAGGILSDRRKLLIVLAVIALALFIVFGLGVKL